MKVALIGASGFVGKAILNELVQRGHNVTAISRHQQNIEDTNQVTSTAVDVMNTEALAKALENHDAVISSYNPGWTNPNIYEDFLKGSKSIQEAVKHSGVKRLLVIGGGGSLFVADGVQAVDTPAFPAEWKPGALAARDYLNIIKEETQLDWTFLSPALEMHQGTSGTRTGKYRKGLENPVFNAESRSIISVEDMAVAIVDEIENPDNIKRRFTVAY